MSLSATRIGFSAGHKSILRDVSVEIKQGLFTAVVGPNGAGKSTLLKIVAGELQPGAGQVKVLEKLLHHFSPRELSKIRSVLSQNNTVAFPFSAEEVVELGLHIHRLTRSEINHIVDDVMHEAGVEHLRHRLYPTLSGGEQQRVQLARALAQVWDESVFPRYLLLDEPTNNLDLAHQHAILFAARKMCSHNLGVMAIVHDLNLAAQYADTIIFMKDGVVHSAGSPEKVMTKDIIEHVFNHPVTILYDDQEKPMVQAIPHTINNNTKQILVHLKA